MHMSAGTLDHCNVSTRKFQGAVQFIRTCSGSLTIRARRLISPALGCTVRAIRCCTSTTSPSRISSSARTQASSIISPLRAAASNRRSSTSPRALPRE